MYLSENAWHYRLVKKMKLLTYHEIEDGMIDLCRYIRLVILALMYYFCIGVLITFVAGFFVMVSTVAGLGVVLLLGLEELVTRGTWVEILVFAPIGMSIFGILYLLGKNYARIGKTLAKVIPEKKTAKVKGKKAPGFLKMAYRRFKDKTCYMVKLPK